MTWMYAELFLDLVFDSRDTRTFTPSNVSKLPNHAMQDQPIGLHGKTSLATL
jgi:hypothetical protein